MNRRVSFLPALLVLSLIGGRTSRIAMYLADDQVIYQEKKLTELNIAVPTDRNARRGSPVVPIVYEGSTMGPLVWQMRIYACMDGFAVVLKRYA